MLKPLGILQWERRRNLQVREAFRLGMEAWSKLPGDPLVFYLACTDYLVPAQRRLIDQDLRLANLVARRVPSTQTEDHDRIAGLVARLHDSAAALGDFDVAAGELRRQGPAARARFEGAARTYIDFVVNVLGARSHPLRHLTSTLLGEADWKLITGSTSSLLREEDERFARVQSTAPAGVDPAAVSTERPIRPALGN